MADFRTEQTLAGRMKALRRDRGIKSMRELAELLEGTNLTQAVLDNIESGRKTNLDLSDLLNLAMALRVPPTYLLVPVGLPDASLDLPGLGSAFANMTSMEFDAWLAGTDTVAYHPRAVDERAARLELEAAREWFAVQAEIERQRAIRDIDADGAGSAAIRLGDLAGRAQRLAAYLRSSGWTMQEDL